MGNNESDLRKVAEEEVDRISPCVNDFLWKSFDSIGKPGQLRKPTPILNPDDIKKGMELGEATILAKLKKDGKWKKDDIDMMGLVFGFSGIGGWAVGLAFTLLTQSNSKTLSMEDIKQAVEDAVLGIMSSEKINDLKGAIMGIIDTIFIDATSSDFSNILLRQVTDLRRDLNKLSVAMENDKQYATMESLDAFTTGWALISRVYLQVHKISPKLVTYEGYKDQVATARTKILKSSKVCFKAHCDLIKISEEGTKKILSDRLQALPALRYIPEAFRDLLANSENKFIQDRIEPRIPVLQQV